MNQQVSILETMTPLDFLEFRNLLTPASGFQSAQFRVIEATLGLEMQNRHQQNYYKRMNEGGFNQDDFDTITQKESSQNLARLINNWLERIPFFENEFWKNYHQITNNNFTQHIFWNDYVWCFIWTKDSLI